jgi:hypothetical protein
MPRPPAIVSSDAPPPSGTATGRAPPPSGIVWIMKAVAVVTFLGAALSWAALGLGGDVYRGWLLHFEEKIGSGLGPGDALLTAIWALPLWLVLGKARRLPVKVFWLCAFALHILDTLLVSWLGLPTPRTAALASAAQHTLLFAGAALFLFFNRKYGWET